MRVADAQVHHGCRQVAGAAAAAQVSVASAAVVGVERRGQRRGEVEVGEVGQGAARVEQALVVGQPGVRHRGLENAAGERKRPLVSQLLAELKSGRLMSCCYNLFCVAKYDVTISTLEHGLL